jgi:hypothetical protein
MVNNVWKRQRWEHAETALTNRLARQLTEAATPPTLSDLESGLSQLSISQLVNLPAPRQFSRKASAKFEPPSPLRAVATVKIQSVRAALLRRRERASKCYNANSDLMVELRKRRAQLVAMDRYNGLAQLRVPNSVFDADAEKITPHFRRGSSSGSVSKTVLSMPRGIKDGQQRGVRSSAGIFFFVANLPGPSPTSTLMLKNILMSNSQVTPLSCSRSPKKLGASGGSTRQLISYR